MQRLLYSVLYGKSGQTIIAALHEKDGKSNREGVALII
jgi:hypothetical protein